MKKIIIGAALALSLAIGGVTIANAGWVNCTGTGTGSCTYGGGTPSAWTTSGIPYGTDVRYRDFNNGFMTWSCWGWGGSGYMVNQGLGAYDTIHCTQAAP